MKKLIAGLLGIVMAAAVTLGVMNVASSNETNVPTIPEGENTLYPAPTPASDEQVLAYTVSGRTITVNLKEFDAKVNAANRDNPAPEGYYYSYGSDDSGNPVRQLLCIQLTGPKDPRIGRDNPCTDARGK